MGLEPVHPSALALAFVPFAISMSFTPGPNNLMLAAAGARFGFLRTLPHIAGALVGFSLITLLVGFGVVQLLTAAPGVYLVMKYVSVAYLLYLAWRIATSETAKTEVLEARPMTLLQALAFQCINPKAWITALGGVTAYTDSRSSMTVQVLVLTAILALIGVGSTTTWTAFGRVIRRYLTTRRRRQVFNGSMASMLVLSILPVLVEH